MSKRKMIEGRIMYERCPKITGNNGNNGLTNRGPIRGINRRLAMFLESVRETSLSLCVPGYRLKPAPPPSLQSILVQAVSEEFPSIPFDYLRG